MTETRISRRDFFLSLLAGAIAAGVPLPVGEVRAPTQTLYVFDDESARWFVELPGGIIKRKSLNLLKINAKLQNA